MWDGLNLKVGVHWKWAFHEKCHSRGAPCLGVTVSGRNSLCNSSNVSMFLPGLSGMWTAQTCSSPQICPLSSWKLQYTVQALQSWGKTNNCCGHKLGPAGESAQTGGQRGRFLWSPGLSFRRHDGVVISTSFLYLLPVLIRILKSNEIFLLGQELDYWGSLTTINPLMQWSNFQLHSSSEILIWRLSYYIFQRYNYAIAHVLFISLSYLFNYDTVQLSYDFSLYITFSVWKTLPQINVIIIFSFFCVF